MLVCLTYLQAAFITVVPYCMHHICDLLGSPQYKQPYVHQSIVSPKAYEAKMPSDTSDVLYLGEDQKVGETKVRGASDVMVADIRQGPTTLARTAHPVPNKGRKGGLIDAILPQCVAGTQALLVVSFPRPLPLW